MDTIDAEHWSRLQDIWKRLDDLKCDIRGIGADDQRIDSQVDDVVELLYTAQCRVEEAQGAIADHYDEMIEQKNQRIEELEEEVARLKKPGSVTAARETEEE